MFGKTRDLNDNGTIEGMTTEDFFGDEHAAAEAVQIAALHDRVIQAESQINSQFTSLATYAQIAQEQIELARAEAKASTERSEHRLTELIERERADRIGAADIGAPNGSGRDVTGRLDALEHSVAQIKATLDECFVQQMALAEAINRLFEVDRAPHVAQAELAEPVSLEIVTIVEPVDELVLPYQPAVLQPPSAPEASAVAAIPGLSLRLGVAGV